MKSSQILTRLYMGPYVDAVCFMTWHMVRVMTNRDVVKSQKSTKRGVGAGAPREISRAFRVERRDVTSRPGNVRRSTEILTTYETSGSRHNSSLF